MVNHSIPTNKFLLGRERENNLASKCRLLVELWQNIFTYDNESDNEKRREIEALENGIYSLYIVTLVARDRETSN